MKHIYLNNPKIENDKYRIRLVRKKDLDQIFELYSNVDNLKCVNTDDYYHDNFHYATMEKMVEKYHFWKCAYKNRWFVRLVIISKSENKIIGVLELMKRRSYDTFDNAIILRLDLFKEYERKEIISELLSFVHQKMLDKCSYSKIAVKATLEMKERVEALLENGYKLSNRILIGIEDNKSYKNYYVKK